MIKKIFFYLLLSLLIGYIFFSCKKTETLCESCINNKPPIADAGHDQTIILPIDSVTLDGSKSSDPDGSIIKYIWTKISGNVSYKIINASSPTTIVKNLTAGFYQFELKVTDNKGKSAIDTIMVIVDSTLTTNHSPIANAGPDLSITLPENSVTLNASSSFDPDNNITSYNWTKISGLSFNISNPTAPRTQVTNLTEGVYLFEIKVTDAGGLFSKDTVQIIVKAPTISAPCENRPTITASLIPIGSLSVGRFGLVSAAAGSKLLFAGGWSPGAHSSRVDIFDTITHSWSTAELTIPERDGMTVATVGSKIFFAGGGNNDWIDVTSRIDIYDAATNKWSTAELSLARNYLSAATIGNKVFFAGGGVWGPLTPGSNMNYHIGSDVVDIYDNSTNTWSTATLSEGRFELSATTVGNRIYFAGGYRSIFSGSDKIDIYDASTNSWSTSNLQEEKASHAGVAIGNNVLWAAGANSSYQAGHHLSNLVEIKSVSTGISSFDCITPKAMFSVVSKNDNIIFFTGYNNGPGNKFDIYNKTTNTWSIGILPVDMHGSAIISVNNTIYVGGGSVNGVYSNQVWKLEF